MLFAIPLVIQGLLCLLFRIITSRSGANLSTLHIILLCTVSNDSVTFLGARVDSQLVLFISWLIFSKFSLFNFLFFILVTSDLIA